MATIRLEDVGRVFTASAIPAPRSRGLAGGQWDRAFAQRAAAAQERADGTRADDHGRVVALEHVNLTVPDGLTCAVLGPSGCGKSTLLRVVAGLDAEYTGTVYYDDRDMREVPPGDRYIGMVFQNYALYPHFPGHGNLSFFFRVHKAPDAEAEERIRATAEIMGFGFEQLLARKPGTLSGGQQQRLAIGRALVRRPRLFLFDEPLSNLDAKLRVQTRVEIKRLLRRFGITALYVTHDQEEAIALSDLIAVMRAGRIEQVGTYAELYARPHNAFVAEFLGKPPMNLLPGRVAEGGCFVAGDVAVPLPVAILKHCEPGQTLTLGVRPEAVKLLLGRAEASGIRLVGEVEMVEPDFTRRVLRIHLRVGDRPFVALAELDQWLRTGERVELALPADQLSFFDGISGRRID